MLKKGGNKNITNQECEVSTIGDAKIIIGAAFGVFVCFLFAMIFVYTGLSVGRKYFSGNSSSSEEAVIDVLPVQYETKTISYYPKIANNDKSEYRELLKKVGGEQDYYVISSNTEYQNVLSELALMGAEGNIEPFELPENFFGSGSIILITKECSYLTEFGVLSLTRDENYHISIDTYDERNSNKYEVSGIAVMIKIDNIQPKQVEVKEDTLSVLDDEDNS